MADVVDPRIKESTLVVVQIGRRRDDFQTIPRALLLIRTNLFSKHPAISTDDDTAAVINIPNTTSDDLRYLVIYAGYLRRGSSMIQFPLNSNGKAKYEADYDYLIDLYIFGSKVEDQDFQDDIMDAILARYKEGDIGTKRWLPDKDIIRKIYEQTSASSPLRKFLVDMPAWDGCIYRNLTLNEHHEDFRRDLLWEFLDRGGDGREKLLSLVLRGLEGKIGTQDLFGFYELGSPMRRGQTIPDGVSCCDYHLHAPGAMCGNRKRKRDAEETAGRV